MAPPSETPALHGRASWIAYGVLLTVAILLLATTFAPLWQPLLIAAVLAGTTRGWHRALSRGFGGRPRIAAALMTFGVVLLVLIPLSFLAVVLVQQALDAIQYVSEALRRGGLEELAERLPNRLEGVVRQAAENLQISELSSGAAAGGMRVASIARDLLAGASRAVFGLIMMLIAYFALLVDGDRLVRWIQGVLPLPTERTSRIFTDFRVVSRSVIGSTVISAAAQAAVAGIGYMVAGVPNVLFFTFLTALVALLPIVGTPIVALPLAGLLLAEGQTWQAIFLAAYSVVVVSTVDNVVKPLVVRGGTALNGTLIFFALIGGLFAFGAIGLIVGPLAVTFFVAMVRFTGVDPKLGTSR